MIEPLAKEENKSYEQYKDISKEVVNAINVLLENINDNEAVRIIEEIKTNQSSLLR